MLSLVYPINIHLQQQEVILLQSLFFWEDGEALRNSDVLVGTGSSTAIALHATWTWLRASWSRRRRVMGILGDLPITVTWPQGDIELISSLFA